MHCVWSIVNRNAMHWYVSENSPAGSSWLLGQRQVDPRGRHHQDGDSPQGERQMEAGAALPGHVLPGQHAGAQRPWLFARVGHHHQERSRWVGQFFKHSDPAGDCDATLLAGAVMTRQSLLPCELKTEKLFHICVATVYSRSSSSSCINFDQFHNAIEQIETEWSNSWVMTPVRGLQLQLQWVGSTMIIFRKKLKVNKIEQTFLIQLVATIFNFLNIRIIINTIKESVHQLKSIYWKILENLGLETFAHPDKVAIKAYTPTHTPPPTHTDIYTQRPENIYLVMKSY